MVDFAGYRLPVQYEGVIAESLAVRSGAGMFDVSHMARFAFLGERAQELLEYLTTNDVSKLQDGQGQYTLLPNESGGLVDDVVLYRVSATEFRMVVNAANHAKDLEHIQALNVYGVEVVDATSSTAMLAVQGPRAVECLASLSEGADGLADLPFFSATEAVVAGVFCFAARSGYTGEDGFELVCCAEQAVPLWEALLGAGVKPCGLGARDTLRLEAGLPLYGHELTDQLSPIAAGLGWAISKSKRFHGSEPIRQAREMGTPVKLQGVKLQGKRLPQPGAAVLVEGKQVGEVSSGVYSPTLGCGIAMVYVEAHIKLGVECSLDLRGRLEPGTIVSKRFIKRS